ncbi:DUF7524 family protein [Halorubrum sp. DTA46]|uniref:DUF7524 family protein n=1 Tax=Halorubrum sp. DTA46 TaxID=3402162 RepID=UPI003AB025D2
MPTLSVELNGDAVHSIRAPDRFTTTGPFAIAFDNLGRSTHVHLNFDAELGPITSLGETNHYIEDEQKRRVHVSVADIEEPVRGKLKIVTGYGSNTRYVDVRIDPPPDATADEIAIDEAFTKPPERAPPVPPAQRAANAVERLIDKGGVPAAVLGFVALAGGAALALALESVVVAIVVGIALTVSVAAVLLAVW